MNYSKLKCLSFVLFFLTLTSCEVAPKKINYGQDHCVFCDMTAVDKTHASEYVTKKGKSYIFDSIECMAQEINQDQNEKSLAFILVADFYNPGKLIDAKTAFYLITPKLKSPMGGNLSAFSSKQFVLKAKTNYGGEIYNWTQIKEKFKK